MYLCIKTHKTIYCIYPCFLGYKKSIMFLKMEMYYEKETSKVKSNRQFISYLLGVQILTPYEQFDGLKRK